MVLISFICNTHIRNKILICSGSSGPVSVVSEQRQQSIGEKDLVRKNELVKEEPAKKLSPRKEEKRAA